MWRSAGTQGARAADLPNDQDDILNEVFALMMQGPTRFDPSRGSALSYIKAVLVPEAIRRVRAKLARPGSKTRHEAVKPTAKLTFGPTFAMPDPVSDPETVRSVGYGSPEAMEAAYDANVIWARATLSMRSTIEGFTDGKSQAETASEMKMDKVARMIKNFQNQFANAA
jgi:RNA polymerase sigma-70 factor (ECF subfamily)